MANMSSMHANMDYNAQHAPRNRRICEFQSSWVDILSLLVVSSVRAIDVAIVSDASVVSSSS